MKTRLYGKMMIPGRALAGYLTMITVRALLHSEDLTITAESLLSYATLYRLREMTIKSAFLLKESISLFLIRTQLNSGERALRQN